VLNTSFAGLPGDPAASFTNKLLGNCLKIWSQTSVCERLTEDAGSLETVQLTKRLCLLAEKIQNNIIQGVKIEWRYRLERVSASALANLV